MNAINRTENARLEKTKGDASWEEASLLFSNGKYDGAVSRAYYAVFHYASALLMTKGLEANSHRGLQRLFHLHFVRTAVFPDKVGVLLGHVQKAREEADYYPEITFTKEIASERLQEAKEFVESCRDYLTQQGIS